MSHNMRSAGKTPGGDDDDVRVKVVPPVALLAFAACTPRSSAPATAAVDAGATVATQEVPSVRVPTLPLPLLVEGKIGEARAAFHFVDRTLTAYYNYRFEKLPPYAVLIYFFKRFDDYAAYVGDHWCIRSSTGSSG